ncbi:phBC6A51 family helix-turn-helix protein [Bacillus chungangensis]|uniref:Glutaredoxin 2 n=1 Tax=Bacillus chungangensis TaxID=587633 RepID=A0ABT9WM66_9BACI|nr:phBC6A51 family helix-turn-helix protein [Bacillus chungangensis]MDQ0174388.1 glutaredoxin 2 [Bacillus chungangensis]
MSDRKRELGAKLDARQRTAAYLLVENEMLGTEERRTMKEIAAEVGVHHKTMWEWRTKNRNFIEYKNEIADDFLSDKRDQVYGQLMKLINSNQPSVRAIDLFLRRFGLLTERQITQSDSSDEKRSTNNLEKGLKDIDALLEDDAE